MRDQFSTRRLVRVARTLLVVCGVKNQRTLHRRVVAMLAALALLLQPLAHVTVSTSPQAKPLPATTPPAKPTTTKAPAAKPASAAATPAAPTDGGWPREYSLASGGGLLLYQPQVSSWAQQRQMVAFSAVSYRPTAADKPVLGTIKVEADTSVSVADRLVNFSRMRITEANFSSLPKERVREITEVIDKAFPLDDRVIALDRVLESLDKSTIIPKVVEGIKADPPAIFFSKTAAVIVNLDGEPIWSPIKENDLKYAVNTNWDLFEHEPTKTFYLRHNDGWLKASALDGPWTGAGTLPPSFKKLPAEDNWKEVKANVPGRALTGTAVPKVFVTKVPGELILLRGEPSYLSVTGTGLLWVNNTESDVFRLGKAGAVYYLVAGRWFSAPDFTGPWTFATPTLPADFKKIPLEHDRSRVLASVPGTDQAAEAVLLAQIPQTARVKKRETKAPDVAYQGNPEFVPIEKTTVQRAVNTDKDIFKVGERYYMCTQGVWFTSAAATGPWEVASSVPEQIYSIPVSSPSHHVTYVTIEEDDDDEWVTFAAAAGYTGLMIGWGCAVWGSGWYYPPYWGYGGGYPYYYPYFPTYGYSAWYNPWTGAYGRSAAVYGPYGGAGVGARYNPRTGTYARGAAAYGPYGARGVAQAYNPRTGTYAQTRQGSNVYGSWGSTTVQRGDDWANTSRVTNNRTGNTTRVTQGDDGGSRVTRRTDDGRSSVTRTEGGDVYAGHDGNVYRKQGDSWQKYENGSWGDAATPTPQDRSNRAATTDRSGTTATQRPATSDRAGASAGPTTSQLERDRAARTSGATRTRDAGNYRSGSSGGGGSYRPSGGRGGGGRGGGGRRR